MSKTVRFVLGAMSVLVGVAVYTALLVFASAKNVESSEVQQRLIRFRGCDQLKVAHRTHRGGGPCFRWERSHLATGAVESCRSVVRGNELPRCASLRGQLAGMGFDTDEKRAWVADWFRFWEEEYENAHHDRAEWEERRQEAEAAGPIDERIAWSIINGVSSLVARLSPLRDSGCNLDMHGVPRMLAKDNAITVERLHVYWLAHQLPAECLSR